MKNKITKKDVASNLKRPLAPCKPNKPAEYFENKYYPDFNFDNIQELIDGLKNINDPQECVNDLKNIKLEDIKCYQNYEGIEIYIITKIKNKNFNEELKEYIKKLKEYNKKLTKYKKDMIIFNNLIAKKKADKIENKIIELQKELNKIKT